MKNISEVKSFWNNVGNKYQDVWLLPATRAMSEKEMNLIKKYLSTTRKTVLDVGVGNGRILKQISENTANDTSIFGIDISEEMIKFCRTSLASDAKIKDLRVVDDITKYDFQGKTFDFITSIRVLKYNSNWSDILVNILHTLNKDGVIIFTLPNKNSINRFHKPSLTHMKATVEEIERIAKENNMEMVEAVGFTRIPDKFYRINVKLFSTFLLFCENVLAKVLGPTVFVREIFYVLKKR